MIFFMLVTFVTYIMVISLFPLNGKVALSKSQSKSIRISALRAPIMAMYTSKCWKFFSL